MNLRTEIKNKPHSASFSNLQISESFQHFRSVSYFEAVTNASLSGSRKSFETHSFVDKPKLARMPSNSTPCTPKKIEIEKYSTLPVTVNGESTFSGKKTRSSSLSSFFRKFKPKFHRNSSDGKNPWIVIEFAPRDDPDASSNSDKSDHSIELAVKSKVQHFTSLKDLSDHPSNDVCNCALSNSRRDSTPKCNLNSFSASKTSINYDNRNENKYKSEGSIFFRLSPRRRLENLKHMLKNFSKRRKFRTSASMHSLGSRSCAYKSESCLKTDYKITSGAFSSFSQDHGRASSPVFHFCKQRKSDNVSLRHSADISYLLKLPFSRSSNASLSSVLEDSCAPKRVQPPNTLSLSSKGFHDQQMLKIYQKMASVESIGACSLDFEASATDNFVGKDVTASECTLHSNGIATSVQDNSRNGDLFHEEFPLRDSFDKHPLTNGCKAVDKQEYTVAEIKLPSYVSISCAINGYANYSRFCRSRDNSPARSSFRKSSLEPSMLADTSRKEAYESHRYSRSQSDCNGTMQSVFTESKRVTVSKQIQIPLKSSIKYTTEVTLSNGHSERTVCTKVVTNGHTINDSLVLAKEVSSDGTKSLVQQRIESLYGKSVGDEIKVNVKSSLKNKDVHVNGTDNSITSQAQIPNGKNHSGTVSPPVFRHLNEDFRKQLQMNIPPKKLDSEKPSTKTLKKLQNGLSKDTILKKEEAFSPISNGIGHDECDRIKSMTPPPIKSKSSLESSAKPLGVDEEREGYKFLNLIDVEKEKIQAQVKSLEEELAVNTNLPEEASGKIRAACGKANLLMAQKFEQFRGLCWKNIEENPSVPFYTTGSDLAGFWDLVLLQVEDINTTLKEIDDMRRNGWKEVVSVKPAPQPAKVRHSKGNAISKSNPTTPKRSAKSSELMKAREEARKQLLAAKKKGRQQTAVGDDNIAIFAPATSS
ncbi:hypothetical protein NPIL_176232 [Nephila pilipes]|uniref:Disks large-associated protein 1 n=1 Tax=Nephila pilipes TaxID=299642 RepID=A0A8X6N4W1_NEPPI|nr:hypothetical protein NPIL_176232 [Nephila pilipes]